MVLHFGPALWSRGSGWVSLPFREVLDSLPGAWTILRVSYESSSRSTNWRLFIWTLQKATPPIHSQGLLSSTQTLTYNHPPQHPSPTISCCTFFSPILGHFQNDHSNWNGRKRSTRWSTAKIYIRKNLPPKINPQFVGPRCNNISQLNYFGLAFHFFRIFPINVGNFERWILQKAEQKTLTHRI